MLSTISVSKSNGVPFSSKDQCEKYACVFTGSVVGAVVLPL